MRFSTHLDDQVPVTYLFSPPERLAISGILQVVHLRALLLLARRNDCQIHLQTSLQLQKVLSS